MPATLTFSRVVCLIGSLALAQLCVSSAASSAEPSQATPWPQLGSDIPADPSVIFGTLPNGMKYAIRRNTTPKDTVVMRLRIGAGSLEEADDQQGLAHFLEHMAFRGSRHVPVAEVWAGLQRLGMTSGADANASTGFTETIYKLDLPHHDEATLETGFVRMRDIASDLTLDPKGMEAERGPILSEERLRDTARYRAYKARTEFLFPGTRMTERYPIGQVEIIKHAGVEPLRRFYEGYYRPDRTALVVVGEVDPAIIRQKIEQHFGDWSPVGPAGEMPAKPALPAHSKAVAVYSERGVANYVSLNWIRPYQPDSDKARQRRNVIDKFALEILARRLQALPPGKQRPFLDSGVQSSNEINAFRLSSVTLEIQPVAWKTALETAVREVRKLEVYGASQQELDRVVTDARTAIQAQADQAATRGSSGIAHEIVESLDNGEVVTSPAENVRQLDEILKTLGPKDIDAAFKALVATDAPLVFISTELPIEGGAATVETTLKEAEAAPVARPGETVAKAWPYTDFGPAGAVAERRVVDDLGTTLVRFENGVRLTIKPTSFQAGQISVSLRIGRGRLAMPKDAVSPVWAIQRGAWIEGGLSRLTLDETRRALSGRVFGAGPGLEDDALLLRGDTRPADLETEMEILTAYLVDPGWRSFALDDAKSEEKNLIAQLEGSPTGVFRRQAPQLLASGDKRWANPTEAEISGLTTDDLKAFVSAQMASGPIEAVIVGDTDLDKTIAAAARTLGTLPKQADADQSRQTLSFPAPGDGPVVLTHKGRADQGIAFIGWPTSDLLSDPQRARQTRVLERIFQTRLTNQLRIADGATYSPGTTLKSSDAFTGYGYLGAYAELPTEKMALFEKVARGIATDLRERPVSEDELDRAKKPRIVALRAAEETNGFWVAVLAGAQTDPRRLDLIREAISGVERVTAEDVQEVAKLYLQDRNAYQLRIEPARAGGAR